MTASKTKSSSVKTTTNKPINSIHIVVFACPNCGEEFEELRLCKVCKNPMKVVQVIEKFGSEANEYLSKLKKEGIWEDTSVRPSKEDHDGGLSTADDELDKIDIKIAGEVEEDTEIPLADIYPDDDEVLPAVSKVPDDPDWEKALEALDEEEKTDDLEDVPDL
ncbi:hypothetical protein M0R04_01560 [Candidatus Dojkabacteria bacterium]|jgi:predicted RNA-binding Zn-ribbon protein involved in translation (DUF1610 family)|nr:hypothetical protein [Candidatus Dojkabacteria bacterium]